MLARPLSNTSEIWRIPTWLSSDWKTSGPAAPKLCLLTNWLNAMRFRVEFDPGAVRELEKLDPQIARRILKFLQERVLGLDDPRMIGAALSGSRLGELWKYRIGDYRVIASIEDNVLTILVLSIGHRRQVYRR